MAFKKPALKNEEAESIIEGHSDRAAEQVSSAGETGKEQLKKTAKEVVDTPGDSLNPQEDQDDNFAKTGGSKGSLTGKDFSSTLNLMRRADEYNNRPVSEIYSVGTRHTGDVQNLGTGYERPKIETEEMREMERNRSLDLQQKQLMIQLQDAINNKNVEAFKSAYEKTFGVTLSTTQAIEAMRQWTQQQQITNIATKDISSWQKDFTRAFDAETLQYLVNLAESGDEQLATLLSNAMYGLPTPSLDERLLQGSVNNLANELTEKEGLSPFRARLKASNVINYVLLTSNNTAASSTKRSQRPGEQYSGYKEAKKVKEQAREL